MKNPVVRGADILLPAAQLDLTKWAVVAVDQYTSQPEYWQRAQELVGDAPSALNMVLPEVYLSERAARIPRIQQAMRDYLAENLLRPAVHNGYILVERETTAGTRLGLMAAVDLECYDFAPGAEGLIRPTEGTVLERVPPRVKMRANAPLELTHVLMLMDDPKQQVIEPLYARRDTLDALYDFELMLGGGRVRGWKVEGEAAQAVDAALDRLYDTCDGLFLAVGDGNHSLAAARQCWLDRRETLTAEERESDPARFALVELENLQSPAIRFEPIHRLLTHVKPAALMADFEAYLREEEGITVCAGDDLRAIVADEPERSYALGAQALRMLQTFLDSYLTVHPEAQIDYIHGDEALSHLTARADAVGFMPRAFAKEALFPRIRAQGPLPRKTFSMGEAQDKRYYLEARACRAQED